MPFSISKLLKTNVSSKSQLFIIYWKFKIKNNGLSKKKLTLDMSKYDFECVCQRKSWLWTCPNITLNIFLKKKFKFKYDQIWLLVCLSKKKLTLNMPKYDFKYVCQKKSWL
jgi:hypothetical protein